MLRGYDACEDAPDDVVSGSTRCLGKVGRERTQSVFGRDSDSEWKGLAIKGLTSCAFLEVSDVMRFDTCSVVASVGLQ